MDTLVSPRAPVLGHNLLSVLSQMGGTATIAALQNAAARAFGPDAVYVNCHGDLFSFREVLAFLGSRGKLENRGDQVSLGPVTGCSGH